MIERRFVDKDGYTYIVNVNWTISVDSGDKPMETENIYNYHELTEYEKGIVSWQIYHRFKNYENVTPLRR